MFLGFLRNMKKPEVLLKPLVRKELKFYQYLQSPDAIQEVAELRKFVPQFKGLVHLEDINSSGGSKLELTPFIVVLFI